jgi:hypothetical protein
MALDNGSVTAMADFDIKCEDAQLASLCKAYKSCLKGANNIEMRKVAIVRRAT